MNLKATVIVHVVPRAPQTEVAGRRGDAMRIRVKAPPVDGAANEELVRFMAKLLGVSRAAVRITRGQTSRHKTLTIDGMTTAFALQKLLEVP